jgi:GNAT superfamily N-acetyltransferase
MDNPNKIETIGHIFMQVEPLDKIKFLDAWVHPNHRRQGIFRALWETRWKYVQSKYSDYTVYAWCLPKSLPLLIEKGFKEGELCTYVERKVYEESRPDN